MPTPVLIRVYDRIADLEVNVRLIRERWQRRDWKLFVISNGATAGFAVPQSVREVAEVIDLPENPGHREGALQLLREGLLRLPTEYKYAVTLEADTWVLDDRVPDKYLRVMESNPKIAWCGANWVDKWHSLAVDFAVVNLELVRQHSELLAYQELNHQDTKNTKKNNLGDLVVKNISIENRLCADLNRLGYRWERIREAEPTHLPKAMLWAVQADGRRRRAFPRVPMVTHHTGDMEYKMRVANRTAGKEIFTTKTQRHKGLLELARWGLMGYERLLGMVPKSRWVRGRKMRVL